MTGATPPPIPEVRAAVESDGKVHVYFDGAEQAVMGGKRADRAEAVLVAWDIYHGKGWYVDGCRGSLAGATAEANRWTAGRVQMPGARKGILCQARPMHAVAVTR